MLGLYIHIPFCVKKCHYCNFVVTTSSSGDRRGRFLKALEKEAAHYAPFFKGRSFDTFYIGGGTPSVLSPEEIQDVFYHVRKNFEIREEAELTCEVNPGDIDAEKARAWRKLGINRISLGAQSFHDDTLSAINRAHDAQDIRGSFRLLKEEGFRNVNLDLMLSLPAEAIEHVRYSLKEAIELGPQHISLYELTIEENTVFGNQFKKGTLSLPAEGEALRMLMSAREFLKSQDFVHYELLNYARPGFESRHNLLYWANGEYLGLGPGAFSYFDGRRFQSSKNVEEYLVKMEKDDWRAAEEETLTPEKKEIESLLLALRLTQGTDIGRFKQSLAKFQGTIGALEQKELLEKDGARLRLTPRGQLFAETVFAELSGPC